MRTTYRKFRPLWLSVLSAIAALMYGCSNAPPISYNVHDEDPSVKIPAIKKAAERRARDEATVRQLVKDLNSDDAAVRFYAIEGLRRLTGETYGYVYYEDESERTLALRKWRERVGEPEEPSNFASTQPAATQPAAATAPTTRIGTPETGDR